MFHQKPGERYAVEAVTVDGASPGVTAPAVTVLSDVRLERWRSMAIGDWQDAADIIESLGRRDREPWSNPESSEWLGRARDQLRRGRPRTAYRSAIRAEQLSFPATYAVMAPGADLRPFPVSVSCPTDRVRVAIRALSREAASLTVLSTVKQAIEVRYRGKRVSLDLTPDVPASAEIELAASGRFTHRGIAVARRQP